MLIECKQKNSNWLDSPKRESYSPKVIISEKSGKKKGKKREEIDGTLN